SRRRHTRSLRDWSSDVCSSDLPRLLYELAVRLPVQPDIQAMCVWLDEPVRHAIRLHVLMADPPAGVRTGMDFPVEDSIAAWVWRSEERRVGKECRSGWTLEH